ncbi:ATP-binding cassette domain-containing protein [Acidaminobacter sp. JC074]|uniref:ABC transporter ATP-binding protein n=1 Tax=Acidaminobacter sp. JC074 TaxID=2530199 RepID=UPI001F1088C5|nr:oligopeptide/dipeptide ABC transporter ATP-binding protein [Acidaminobacter sp. JC074]MCH4886340.1 ATP-binding cassette domain-containing protein [Acidaminobacter sp. JC074]
MSNILEVKNLVQQFDLNKSILDKIKFKNGKVHLEEKIVHAVNDVSFNVKKGEVFSLVGESGCGKSTTARTIIKLLNPHSGDVLFDGLNLSNLSREEMVKQRSRIQMIFQDPYASLNPRQRVIDILMEPMLFHKKASSKEHARTKCLDILTKVGIRPEQADRYPHQFSGGQRQRIGIARALAVEPEFIVADEPVSALDVSIQAQILNLLMDLKEEYKFSYLFIAHDLSVVKHISDKIGVMYLGKIVETGTTEDIFSRPKHPYTLALFDALPRLEGNNLIHSKGLEGEIQSPINLPDGCFFYERCTSRKEVCKLKGPVSIEVEPGHLVACHLFGEAND